MSIAYVDTSVVVSILFREPGSTALRRKLDRSEALVTSDLLVAELASAAARERVEENEWRRALDAVSIVLPDRSLEPEVARALVAGRLRGADLWHLACALFVAGERAADLVFLTADLEQRRVARVLGFGTG